MRKSRKGGIGDAISPKNLHRNAIKLNCLRGTSRVSSEVVVEMNAGKTKRGKDIDDP